MRHLKGLLSIHRYLPCARTLLLLMGFCMLLALSSPLCFADNAPDFKKEAGTDLKGEDQNQERADAPGMRAEYDKISAIKMKKYDELMWEITGTRNRIEELLAKEQKLLGEKEKAEAALAKCSKAAEVAGENVKKALGDASAEDEKMRSFAAVVAKESAARQKKIEKLKADFEELDGKKEQLQSSKNKTEAANAARDTEYKDISKRLLALKAESSAGGKNKAEAEDESARLKKLMSELEIKTHEGELLRQRLSDEILASAEKSRSVEEEISALEREDASRAKELRVKIGDFDKTPNGDQEKVPASKGLKKIAEEANLKWLNAKAALKEIDEALVKVSGEKLQAEKDLVEKTGELKVRISALVVQSARDQELLLQGVNAGEKDIKKRLKRAEKDVVELRRKMERSLWDHKELKTKFNKEMLDKHFNLAVLYEMNGLYKDAEREYLECLKIEPKDADVHYNLAILYDDRLNNNKKAQQHYYKFLACRPIGEPGEDVRDWIMRSELEKRLGSTVR